MKATRIVLVVSIIAVLIGFILTGAGEKPRCTPPTACAPA